MKAFFYPVGFHHVDLTTLTRDTHKSFHPPLLTKTYGLGWKVDVSDKLRRSRGDDS